ncbi:hypothetical protein [Nitrincola iocasae]|uniref:Uncharacterized protein n=1 Tax=Nitrincola iocasae TaxID=2614693 RepID=A0A5J6LG19_9GAMM|nr:hypothetical protein [Nitrincola iocasae]QEW07398.1 hypothetical protein F5I99_13355 [Nitrincola iocasae]
MIELAIDGQIYQADYVVVENVVTVYGDNGFQSTQLGGLSEERVAKILLKGLIQKGLIKPVE